MPHFDGSATNPLTFQLVLFEGSSDILFNYADVWVGDAGLDAGASATVGIQVATEVATQWSYNTASLSDDTTLLWKANAHPVADAGPDQGADPGAVVTLEGTNSSDADGNDTLMAFRWTQISGAAVALADDTAATTIFTTASADGAVEFELAVTDDYGAISKDRVRVAVGNGEPILSIDSISPDPAFEGQVVTLSATIADLVSSAGTSYRLNLDWGDGSIGVEILSSPGTYLATHVYADDAAGGFGISLNVSDESDAGGILGPLTLSARASLQIAVNNAPPSITSVDVTPLDPAPGDEVTLIVTALDAAGSADPLTYSFDFDGDSNFDTIHADASASWFFPEAGDHTVRIRVDDDDGGSVETSTDVAVVALEPSGCGCGSRRSSLKGLVGLLLLLLAWRANRRHPCVHT